MKLYNQPILEEDNNNEDQIVSTFLSHCDIAPSKVDPNSGAIILSKEEWDDWD